jgi:hypothetical protein
MSERAWLEHATQFLLKVGGDPVTIEARDQRDGVRLWGVYHFGSCLNIDGEWEYEPIPSSRDDGYLQRTRLRTKEDALARLMQFAEGVTLA